MNLNHQKTIKYLRILFYILIILIKNEAQAFSISDMKLGIQGSLGITRAHTVKSTGHKDETIEDLQKIRTFNENIHTSLPLSLGLILGLDLLEIEGLGILGVELGLKLPRKSIVTVKDNYEFKEQILELPIIFFWGLSFKNKIFINIGYTFKFNLSSEYKIINNENNIKWVNNRRYNNLYTQSNNKLNSEKNYPKISGDIIFGSTINFFDNYIYLNCNFRFPLQQKISSENDMRQNGPQNSKFFINFNRFLATPLLEAALGIDIMKFFNK